MLIIIDENLFHINHILLVGIIIFLEIVNINQVNYYYIGDLKSENNL